MRLIFVSLIFLLFDINVTSYEIDILPDFLGWIFILIATFKMSDLIKYASYAKSAEIIMLIISVPYEALYFCRVSEEWELRLCMLWRSFQQ